MITPTVNFQFQEVKKWFKQFEKCMNCGDYESAHVLALKIGFWTLRLPVYDKEAKERMNCTQNEKKVVHST